MRRRGVGRLPTTGCRRGSTRPSLTAIDTVRPRRRHQVPNRAAHPPAAAPPVTVVNRQEVALRFDRSSNDDEWPPDTVILQWPAAPIREPQRDTRIECP